MPYSNEIELTRHLEDLKTKRDRIVNDPEGYITERVSALRSSLSKIQPRKPTKPGNISMHQYLSNLITDYQRGERVQQDLARLNHSIQSFEENIRSREKDRDDEEGGRDGR